MALREQNEAVAGLLRQSLAKGAPAQACPDSELLAAYFEHSLAEDESAMFDEHLSKCARCRAQLAAMVRADLPKPHPKTFWLLDWRLLSAAALVLVIATVWFLRRPMELAPVVQNVGSPVAAPAPAPNTDSSTAPNVETRSTNEAPNSSAAESLKKSLIPERLAGPRIKPATRIEQAAAPKGMRERSKSAEAKPVAPGSANADLVQTESPALGTPQPAAGVASGQGHGVAPKQIAPSAGSAGAVPRQMQPSSEMVLVQPGAPPPQVSAPARATRIQGKESANPSPGVVSGRESVDVASSAQSETVTSAQKPSDKLVSAYAANDAATQVQILEDRSREKVIDTPIAAVKWRITPAGFVERSEDGGATWVGQEPAPEAHLIAGSAPTDKVCWLVGKEGVVLVTKDAANWEKIPPPATADITSVSAKSASDATVTTSDGRRFTTHNKGKKWKPSN